MIQNDFITIWIRKFQHVVCIKRPPNPTENGRVVLKSLQLCGSTCKYNEISGHFAEIVDPQASGNITTVQNGLTLIFINNLRHKKSF